MNKADKYSVKDFLEEAELVHSGPPGKTALPSYVSKDGFGRQVRTRLDYQLRGVGDKVVSDSFPVLYDTKHTASASGGSGKVYSPCGGGEPYLETLTGVATTGNKAAARAQGRQGEGPPR